MTPSTLPPRWRRAVNQVSMLVMLFGALPVVGALTPPGGSPVVTAVARTIQLAYDCHEGSCQVPELDIAPVPVFSNLPTRLRIIGTGLSGSGSESGFRIAFAKSVPTTLSANGSSSPTQESEGTYAGSSCDDYLVTEVYKPVPLAANQLIGPGKLLAANPLIGGKLRGGKSRKDPTIATQGLWAGPGHDPTKYASGSLLFDVMLPPSDQPYKLCFKASNATRWVFTDPYPWLQVRTLKVKSRYILPLWLEVCLIILLFTLSGLFSGLNLGLMSLDQTELRLLEKSGTPNERKCTAKIMPLRRRGNFLLCTLVFGNVLVNSTLTILLENLSSGKVAVVVSTIGITLFGEIIPQAVCARYGLEIGAKTVWITKFFMLLTAPLAYPISLILDRLLGEDIGSVYDRQRLIELVKLTENYAQLGKEEVDIITGALIMRNKTVGQIMTPMRDVYMLAYESVLDFRLLTDIVNSGYTRIPVYEGPTRSNVVAVLNVKDLAFVDPDDKIPLKTVLKFYNHAITYVFEDTPLGSILEEFKKGSSHMAFVRRVVNEGDKDPYYEIIGLVTLEDVIEEIIQGEILDETDRLLDNRNKQVRHRKLQDFSLFFNKGEADNVDSPLTPQMALVTYQFLNANVEPFKDDYISANVLRKLIRKHDVIFVYNVKDDTAFRNYWNPSVDIERSNELYTKDVPADYFVLILEGRVRVYVGAENICFESGPFSYFGVQALNAINMDEKAISQNFDMTQALKGVPVFVPDYTIYPVSSLLYIKIKRVQYLAARRATSLEKAQLSRPSSPPPPSDPSPPAGPGTDQPITDEQGVAKIPNGHLATADPEDSSAPPIFNECSDVLNETNRAPAGATGGTMNPLDPPRTPNGLSRPTELSPSLYGNYSHSAFASRDSLLVAGGGSPPYVPQAFPPRNRLRHLIDMHGSVQTLPALDRDGVDRTNSYDVTGSDVVSDSPPYRPRSYSHRASPMARDFAPRSRTATTSDDSVIVEEGGDEEGFLLQPLPPSSGPSSPPAVGRPLQPEGRARSLSALFKSMGNLKGIGPSPQPGTQVFKRRLTRNYDGTLKESLLTTSDSTPASQVDGTPKSLPSAVSAKLPIPSLQDGGGGANQPFFPDHDIVGGGPVKLASNKMGQPSTSVDIT